MTLPALDIDSLEPHSAKSKMKKTMTFGTFDGIHKGHEYYLQEAKKLGDYLVVVIALDETVEKVKGKTPKYSAAERKKLVESLGIADKVAVGNPGDKLKVVVDEKPDVICLGYDQRAFTENLLEKLRQRGINPEIRRIPAYKPEVYKSSKINI